MKRVFSLFIVFLLAIQGPSLLAASTSNVTAQDGAAQAQDAPAPLSNKDVVDMLRAGLAPEIVSAKIKASKNNFDTSPTALQELKTASVPDAIILAMVQASTPPDTSVSTAKPVEMVEVKVPDGTAVEIELNETISSENLKEGSIVDFTVVQPVQVDGVTIIAKGAPAKARITKAKKAGYWGRSGKLEWAMQDTATADGNRIPLRFTGGEKGSASTGKVATGVAVTAIIFFPAAPLWGFKKGKNAIIPAGQRYQVAVHGDALVKGNPAAGPAAATMTNTTEAKP